MPASTGQTFITDGSLDFSGGVNSLKVTTIASARNPNGLQRDELAWMVNCSCRDGGLIPRSAYVYLSNIKGPASLYQGAGLYQPDNANPYLLVAISGHIYKVDPTAKTIQDLTPTPALQMPPTQLYFFFVQAEQFMVIQAGDFVTLPLFWDGATLRRSKGITNTAVAPGTPGVNEIPPAGSMDYFMGRLWYAQGRQYSAGDIVKGGSGSAQYGFRDSVLNVTESPMVLGQGGTGDGFTVPDQAGNVRALFHSTQINATLGQGQLFAFARRAVYAQLVPITRTLWLATTNLNQPQQTIINLNNGSVNDRSIVAVNGDLYFQTLQPGIASLMLAQRYFDQPGNLELSAAENRILQFVDRSLLPFATGTLYDNRLLQSSLPKQLPQGVVHTALIPLDFLPISTFRSSFNPVWEGHQEGLQILQLFTGDFGFERSFAITVSAIDTPSAPAGSIQLYEIVQDVQFDTNPNGEARIQWQFETPAYTWGDEFALKKLVSAELWVDRIFGTVLFKMEYRPDGETCWQTWHEWEVCSARNTCEDVINPVCYPITPYGEGYRQTMGLPKPPEGCARQMGRPMNVGFQFQCRLTVHGFCRVRGLQLFAEPVQRSLYGQMVCLLKKFMSATMNKLGQMVTG